MDPITQLKNMQKQSWALFTPIEIFTTMPAATLVNYSNIQSNQKILDVGCGTGVVSITAARRGVRVYGVDLCPSLIEKANYNAKLAGVEGDFREGDVEELPYPDASFDAVLSQFGHMFAPRPDVAIKEMLRVLKPGGTLAFSTWPPHLYVGQLFGLVSRFSPPLPEGASPSTLWGDPNFIREKLNQEVSEISFDQGIMLFPALSFGHYRQSIESTIGPILKLVQDAENHSEKLKAFRQELDALVGKYFKDNHIQQHFLMTRAIKK